MGRRIITALLMVALALPLSGCWKEQQQAFVTCNAKIPFTGTVPALARVKTRMVLCMEKAGYVMDFDNSFCQVEAFPRRSPYCYRPEGFFASMGYRLEMLGNHGPKVPGPDFNKP